MPKETQKQAIERLENTIKEKELQISNLKNTIDKAYQKINEIQSNADDMFQISPYKKELERELFILEEQCKLKEKRITSLESKLASRESVYKLNFERSLKNPRAAGRKKKFDDDQMEEILTLRKGNISMRKIAEQFNCSAALIHNIIKNSK